MNELVRLFIIQFSFTYTFTFIGVTIWLGKLNTKWKHLSRKCQKATLFLPSTTRTKLILKGINPNKFTKDSPDDPVVLEKLKDIAEAFGVKF